MQKILIMVFALALNSGLNLQASGEPVKEASSAPIIDSATATKFRSLLEARRSLIFAGTPANDANFVALNSQITELENSLLKCFRPDCTVYKTLRESLGCEQYCSQYCLEKDWYAYWDRHEANKK
jgi:hypothetical protein